MDGVFVGAIVGSCIFFAIGLISALEARKQNQKKRDEAQRGR